MEEQTLYRLIFIMAILCTIGIIGGLIVEPVIALINLHPTSLFKMLVYIFYQVVKIVSAIFVVIELLVFKN